MPRERVPDHDLGSGGDEPLRRALRLDRQPTPSRAALASAPPRRSELRRSRPSAREQSVQVPVAVAVPAPNRAPNRALPPPAVAPSWWRASRPVSRRSLRAKQAASWVPVVARAPNG